MEEKNEILQHAGRTHEPPRELATRAHIGPEEYKQLYRQSIEDTEGFWDARAKEELEWFKPWDKVLEWNYPDYKWFTGGKINIIHNCLDRHVKAGNGSRIAYTYANEIGEEQIITYEDLLAQTCRLANALLSLGVEKGDRVAIYMPLTINQITAMLACARIGAVHSVVYAGFSSQALQLRINDAQAKVLMTSTHTKRRGKQIDLLAIAREAVQDAPTIEHVLVDRRGDGIALEGQEKDFDALIENQNPWLEAPAHDSEDPLYILYTSGTTGKPKGVVHTTGGYNLYTHYTARMIFDLRPEEDIFWCTADTGWVTGHSYIVYGPLSNGITSVIYEGAPDYPDPSAWWKVIEKYKVNKFYTAPTAVRLFMKYGAQWPQQADLSSLRILGSVGEPINPEAWEWYQKHIGSENTTVVDTWWQTETGGHMIVTLPSMPQKPGTAGLPFFGIEADVVNQRGEPVADNTVGVLIIRKPWPSALRTCYGEPERYNKYWNEIDGVFFASDLATRDEDGYIMILGRSDDVLTVAGHRIGTAEVESALVSHPAVAEAAVIGKPDEIKGQRIKAFVILASGQTETEALHDDIRAHVREEIGGLGVPSELEIVERLPKTRSGKIMRRVLKAKELGMDTGDTSTLED